MPLKDPVAAKAYQKARYQANKARLSAANQAWQKAHPESVKASKKKWRDAHPNFAKLHRLTQRHRCVLSGQNAKVKQRFGVTVKISLEDWTNMWKAFGGRCAYCGSDHRVGMDHIVPMARGGRHHIANVLPACWTCNQLKHAIPPEHLDGARRVRKDCLLCQAVLPIERFRKLRRGSFNAYFHLCRSCEKIRKPRA